MKILLAFAAILGIHAAPIGNTASPDLIEKGIFSSSDYRVDIRAGYEGDFVTDGRMNQFEQGTGRVDCYQQNTNSGTFTLNFVDRLDIYGVFGSSDTKAEWRISTGDEIHRLEMKTQQNFLWAVGARAILYEWCKISLGMGGRYSECDYAPEHFFSDGIAEPVLGTFCHWRQWQVNLDFSYKIKIFTPYIGVKYSDEKTHLGNFTVPIASDGSGSNSFQNRDPVGLYLGCALSNGHYFMVNLEGRLIDEEAVTISAELRF